MRSRLPSIALWLLIAVIALMPTLQLVFTALGNISQGKDSTFIQVMSEQSTWQATLHSLYTSLTATVISLIIGGFFAFIVVLTNIRAKAMFVFSFMLPMMIPPQVTALAWLQLFGPASPLLNTLGIAPKLGSPQPLYSPEGIALLMGIQHAPLVFLTLRAHLLNLPKELIEAARISSASQTRVWLDIVFPLTFSGFITGAALAFVSALGNFGIPAMLGIPVSYYVLPTLIYQKMSSFGASMLGEVATLAFCVGVIALFGVIVQQRLLNKRRFSLLGHSGQAIALNLGRWRVLVELILILVLLIILIVPLAALLISSVVPALGVALTSESFSLSAYMEMFTRQGATARAFINSLSLASASMVMLMILSLFAAYVLRRQSRRKQTIAIAMIDLPYALPGIVLSIACILLFVRPIPILNIHLYGSLGIIFIAYLMRFFSVALKPVMTGLAQLDPSLEHAAQLAGASAWQRIKDIILPLLAPSIFAGGILVFLITVNELTVSALLWSAGNETIGVMIFNLDESGSSILAAALSVVVVIMVVALMAALNLFHKKLPKGVIPWQH